MILGSCLKFTVLVPAPMGFRCSGWVLPGQHSILRAMVPHILNHPTLKRLGRRRLGPSRSQQGFLGTTLGPLWWGSNRPFPWE